MIGDFNVVMKMESGKMNNANQLNDGEILDILYETKNKSIVEYTEYVYNLGYQHALMELKNDK